MKLHQIWAPDVNPAFCCLFYTDNVLSLEMVTTGTHRDFAVDWKPEWENGIKYEFVFISLWTESVISSSSVKQRYLTGKSCGSEVVSTKLLNKKVHGSLVNVNSGGKPCVLFSTCDEIIFKKVKLRDLTWDPLKWSDVTANVDFSFSCCLF